MTPITLPAEMPDGMHLCGSWYAVPTGDQDAVLEAFGLAEPEPVTLRAGAEAWKRDQHVWDRRPHARCSRAFVSPVLGAALGRPRGTGPAHPRRGPGSPRAHRVRP
ncbi:hypothetical protein [Streptomyces sp. NPDC048242]|uniref:hypothetical protein n=1 Tax=Streptomyces sp. NPDC048242 TaxID=3155026 RepID=UPI00343716CD